MKREDFLKRGIKSLGAMAIMPVVANCKSGAAEVFPTDTNIINSDPTVTPASCNITNTETAGPYPTHSPKDYIIQSIVSDRTGNPLTIKVYVRNVSNGCAIIKDAVVDIWHCDAAGDYSEYGSSSSAHFLRGRQSTDANGMAAWKSIFPGWYPGRAPHIHVQIFNTAGKSLLTTQIAFPKDICDKVYTQGVYKTKGLQNTTNAQDGIFSDGVATELATITGNVTNGFELIWTVYVKA